MPIPKRPYHKRGKLVHGYLTIEHPLYTTWHNMLRRCFEEKDANYSRYGGRGITVCERWMVFENFAIDMGLKPHPSLTLERKDNDREYSPDNCKWGTRSEQCFNRRDFKNNTTGSRGIIKRKKSGMVRYSSRFDYEGVRYQIGCYYTVEEAEEERNRFVRLFFSDRKKALEMISEDTLWCTSSTKIRGITPHKDGGFIVRITENKERIYLGYYKTLEEAKNARSGYAKKRIK